MWQSENGDILKRERGSYAPYRIRNRTGNVVNVWSERSDNRHSGHDSAVRMQSGDTIDWRFDDWKASREVCHISLFLAPDILIQWREFFHILSTDFQTITHSVCNLKTKPGSVYDI